MRCSLLFTHCFICRLLLNYIPLIATLRYAPSSCCFLIPSSFGLYCLISSFLLSFGALLYTLLYLLCCLSTYCCLSNAPLLFYVFWLPFIRDASLMSTVVWNNHVALYISWLGILCTQHFSLFWPFLFVILPVQLLILLVLLLLKYSVVKWCFCILNILLLLKCNMF